MKLIVTHEQPDFDALASLALAKFIHPGFEATVIGALPDNVRALLHLYRDQLELIDLNDILLEEVTELVVVDTSEPSRIRPFDRLLGKVPVTVYDHHPPPTRPIAAARGIQEPVGATVTLLTRQLMAGGSELPAALASLALLGIHEDTGNLSYPMTRPDDYLAAGYLLRCGANLALVEQFAREPYRPEHRAFLHTMLEHVEEVKIAGYRVVVSAFDFTNYLPGIAPLCNQLLSLYAADAALLVVGMGGKTLLFARALKGFDVAAALAESCGGGGHPGAAFGRSLRNPREAKRQVLAVLTKHAQPPQTARKLMSAPVITIGEHVTITDAIRQLARFGHNGLPVEDQAGKLVGIVSRRDLERALRHGLGNSPVAGFMSREVVTAEPETTLTELEALVIRHNIGRIPIIEDGVLIGIITRSDLIAARHQQHPPITPWQRVLNSLPGEVQSILGNARRLAGNAPLYLVGGSIRDVLLGIGIQDLDLVVEGLSAETLGSKLQMDLGGRLSCHLAFGTCSLKLTNGLNIDLAAARDEYYQHPGALPTVTPSNLRKDLARRDFTINALAVRLNPEPPEVIDPFGGLRDLEMKQLRILHPLSFVEDPTRILRGARLAVRVGLHFEEATWERAGASLVPEVLRRVGRARLRAELELTLAEARVAPILALLDELGALEAMFGMRADRELLDKLDMLRRQKDVPDESYLLALLLRLPNESVEAQIQSYHWPRRLITARERLLRLEPTGEASEEELEQLSAASRALAKALDPTLASRVATFEASRSRRKLRGRDVLDLGLSPGPQVGRILREVAKARADRRVCSFEEELELAKKLVSRRAMSPADRE